MTARGRRPTEEDAQPNFWASYSDLMAGMLMVFILLLVVALYHFAESNRQKEKILEVQEERLKSFHELQRRLIGNLEKEITDTEVTIDPNTGMLRIGSGILFGEGESTLRPDGQAKLDKIFDAYIKVVLDEEFRDVIRQIEIEGHTNSNGPYLYNLELSQRRALTVMREFLSRAGPEKARLQQIVLAGGRSFANLIRDEDGNEDAVRSRRIELHLRLKEGELFRNIYQDLVAE